MPTPKATSNTRSMITLDSTCQKLKPIRCVLVIGLATLYSAAYQAPGRVGAQALYILLALALMWVAAQVPPQTFMR